MAQGRIKQLLSTLITIFVASVAVISLCLLSAFSPHEHVLTYVERREPTCAENGEEEHWNCKICGKNFGDENASVQLSTVFIPHRSHTFTGYGSDQSVHFRKCIVCGEPSQMSAAQHVLKFTGDENTHYRYCYCGYEDTHGEHVYAEDGGPCTVCGYGGLLYQLSSDGSYYICLGASNSSKNLIEEFIIPDKYKGLPVMEIADRAFGDCTALKKITFGANIITLGDKAFLNCTALESVSINRGLMQIGILAFDQCESIEEIVLPQSLISIGERAFSYCKSLKKINIPSKITAIGTNTFAGCVSLTSITLPNSITEISLGAFHKSGLTEIVFPGGLTEIPQTVCLDCVSLTAVTIPTSVKKISTAAFSGCTNLTVIKYLGSQAQWEKIDLHYGYPQDWNYKVPEECEIKFSK